MKEKSSKPTKEKTRYPVHPRFPTARSILRLHKEDSKNFIAEHRHIIEKTRMYELLGTSTDDNLFTPAMQHAVMGIVTTRVGEPDLYDWINYRIGDSVFTDVSSNPTYDLVGNYYYWRFFGEDVYSSKIYRGYIDIGFNRGIYEFGHISGNVRKPAGYEDTGFAFYAKPNLYMLGFRKGNMRLGIGRVPKDLSLDPIVGCILSSSMDKQLIFTSCFVMFSTKNKYHKQDPDPQIMSIHLRKNFDVDELKGMMMLRRIIGEQ